MAQGVRVAFLLVAAVLATATGFPLFAMLGSVNRVPGITAWTAAAQATLFGLSMAFGAWVAFRKV